MISINPGSDVPEMPAEVRDALVVIKGIWEPPAPANYIAPGSMVIMRAEATTTYYNDCTALFTMGRVVPDSGMNAVDGSFIVEWWVPCMGKSTTNRRGKKKLAVDIFGSWQPLHDLADKVAAGLTLPSVLRTPADVLYCNVELEQDNRIPFQAFDFLRVKCGIDATAMNHSRTHYGDMYRSYVLLSVPERQF